jgi:hypothetical protein
MCDEIVSFIDIQRYAIYRLFIENLFLTIRFGFIESECSFD